VQIDCTLGGFICNQQIELTMIPGKSMYYECPVCTTVLARGSLLSGNTIGAQLFSDSKQIAPMLPEFPVVSKCPNCQKIFWLNNDNETEDTGNREVAEARFLTINDYLALLAYPDFDARDEFFVREQIWWAFNDRVRNGKPLFNTVAEELIWSENAQRLIELLDIDDIDQRIMQAELYRNLGKFEECQQLLNTLDHPDIQWLVDLFAKEIVRNNKMVFQLN
jgi:hypothetical protein